MYFADEIILITEIYPPGADDTVEPEVKETKVFCDLQSVTSQDFRNAGLDGAKPAMVAVVRICDYSGQTEVMVGAQRLHVYRTYRQTSRRGNPDLIELHLEERVAGHGKEG